MADVHCACDRRPNRAVAVKVIAILDAGHRRREYIVMELVDDADLYSVAAVAYRLLGGRAPAPARALSEARPDLPSSLTRAVEQALARDPAARQESAMRFRAQLMAPWSGSLRRVLRAAGRT